MNEHARALSTVSGGLGLALALVVACPEQQQEDRRAEVLEAVVTQQLGPDLDAAATRAEALHARVGELCAAPEAATLDAAQDAWWQLRAPWKRLLAVPLGPIVDEGYDSALDFWPARPSSVEGGIAGGTTTQAELDGLGVASKGMPAIEYLLWDPVAGDEAVLAALTGAEGPSRCVYVELLAGDLALRLVELRDELFGPFAAELRGAGSSEMYPELALAIDALVNAMITGLHDIDDPKLAKPLGLKSGGAPDPELVESRFSDRSLADARDGLAGFEAAYLGVGEGGVGEGGVGDGGVGLSVLVAARNPELDAEVRAALDQAKQALAAVPEPLRTALSEDPAAVEQAQVAVKALRVLLTADVASLLGVTVSLSDNDGD